MKYPCPHFDAQGNGPGPDCPDSVAKSEDEACQYYLRELAELGPDDDIHKPCLEKMEHYKCDGTRDMFEEENHKLDAFRRGYDNKPELDRRAYGHKTEEK